MQAIKSEDLKTDVIEREREKKRSKTVPDGKKEVNIRVTIPTIGGFLNWYCYIQF